MLTEQWAKLFTSTTGNVTAKMVNGNNGSLTAIENQSVSNGAYMPSSISMQASGTGYAQGCRLIPGCGNTPATPTDYTLEDPLIIYTPGSTTPSYKYTNVNFSDNSSIQDSRVFFGKRVTVTNNRDEAITVKELGLVSYCYMGNTHTFHLLARKVLKTPVEIKPFERYTFTYEIGIPTSDD